MAYEQDKLDEEEKRLWDEAGDEARKAGNFLKKDWEETKEDIDEFGDEVSGKTRRIL